MHVLQVGDTNTGLASDVEGNHSQRTRLRKQLHQRHIRLSRVALLISKVLFVTLVIPGMMTFIGYVVDRTLYGGGANKESYHSKHLVFAGLIASPFILVRWCWLWPKHLGQLEMAIYALHTMSFLTASLTTMIDGATVHTVSKQIRDVFVDSKYTGITEPNHVYNYLEHILRKLLDNTRDPSVMSIKALPGRILFVGVLRVKQSRTKIKQCSHGLRNLGSSVTECYPQYSRREEDREPFGTGNASFTFANPSFTNFAGNSISMSDIHTVGRLGRYPLAGYWVLFSGQFLESEALGMVKYMRAGGWIGPQTRQLSVDFALVVKDLPDPVVAKVVLMVEVSPAGKYIPMPPLISFSYAKYVITSNHLGNNVCSEINVQGGFLLPLYLGVVPVAVYMLFSLVLQMYESWRQCLGNLYTFVEVFWLGMISATLVFRWLSIYYSHCRIMQVPQPVWPYDVVATMFVDEVLPMGFYWHKAREMLALALFLYMFKSLKFLTRVLSFDTVGRTLSHAFRNLASFSLSFSVIFIGFASMFFLLFSADDDNYRSFPHAIGTVWMALLGNIAINNDLLVSREMYLPLIIVFTFFLAFVLLTVVVAIVSDAFEKTKVEMNKKRRQSRLRLRSAVNIVMKKGRAECVGSHRHDITGLS